MTVVVDSSRSQQGVKDAERETSSVQTQEVWVALVLALVVACASSLLVLVIKYATEERKRRCLPLVVYVMFASCDILYRKWAALETVYGARSLEFAFARMSCSTVLAFILSTDYFSMVKNGQTKERDRPESSSSSTCRMNGNVLWLFWVPLIGVLWGLEECLASFPESFVSLLLAWIALTISGGRMGSRVVIAMLPVELMGEMMVKSGHVSGWGVLAATFRVCRSLLVDWVFNHHQTPVSPITLMWTTGISASATTLLAFFTHEALQPTLSVGSNPKGILDYLAAGGFGTFFTFGTILASLETMKVSSVVSLQSASCIVEVCMVTILLPMASLPLEFERLWFLNVPGLLVSALAAGIIIRYDSFGNSNLSSALFRFLHEEEQDLDKQDDIVQEIEEGEWLLKASSAHKGRDV